MAVNDNFGTPPTFLFCETTYGINWAEFLLAHNFKVFLGPIWIEVEMRGSRVEMTKNRLILSQIYFTLLLIPPPQSKQTIKTKGQQIM